MTLSSSITELTSSTPNPLVHTLHVLQFIDAATQMCKSFRSIYCNVSPCACSSYRCTLQNCGKHNAVCGGLFAKDAPPALGSYLFAV